MPLIGTIILVVLRYRCMSHIDSKSGLEHGKIGDRIAVVLDGKQIYKKLYKPTNPRTPKQQMHRAKFACFSRLSKELEEAVNLGFAMVPVPGSSQKPRNVFVKMNWDNGSLVWDEENCGWGICPERLLLSYGPRALCCGMSAEVVGRVDGKTHEGLGKPLV